MIPDKARIVECPYCGEKKELLSLRSGNTCNAKYWSDGKMIAPMLPLVSPVQKCPRCGKYYLHYKLGAKQGESESCEQGELSYGEWKEAYLQFQKPTEASILNRGDWAAIRMGLIHAYNDRYRDGGFLFRNVVPDVEPSQEDFKFIVGIIEEYIIECDWSSVENPFLKAELYREAGDFENCKKSLTLIGREFLGSDDGWIYDEIFTRAKNKDVRVFRILNERKRSQMEYENKLRESKEAEQRWMEDQLKDSRYKVCKRGHCYKNTQRLCWWCGNDNVVKRVDENEPREVVELYMVQCDGHWLLTKNNEIGVLTGTQRKITVELLGGYKLCYRIDGQEDFPYNNTMIKVGSESVNARRITEKCDLLIDEGLEKVHWES